MAPKFKVGADVVHYFVLVTVSCGAAYAFTQIYGESEEVKESKLRAKYPQQIKKSENQQKQMQEFFDQMKNSDKALDDRMNEVLKGGKGNMKRHHDLVKPAPVLAPPPTSADPTKTDNSVTVKVAKDAPAATSGWWNGWGWW